MEEISATAIHLLEGLLTGNLLTALCFGILSIQTFTYYHAFPNDGWPLKLAVAFLWTLQAFQLACVTRSLYWWLVINYHNPLALGRATWEFSMFQINIVCTSVTVQTFFAHRVYSVSHNLYIGVLVQVLVLLQFGFGAATSVVVNANLGSQEILKKYTWLVMTWFTIQAIADIVIAACMCLLLRHRRTGFRKTDSVLNRMVLYAFGTGLITSVVSCFILGLVAKYGFYFTVQYTTSMPLGPIYSITTLANLHMRTKFRATLDTPTPLELISYSIKRRIWKNVGDHGSPHPNGPIDEGLQDTRMNVATEVVCDDVNIRPMNSDTKARFPVVHDPGFGGRSESYPKVSGQP